MDKKNLLISFVSFLLVLLGAESFLANFYPQNTYSALMESNINCYQRSDYLPFKLKPNCQSRQKTEEFEFFPKTNSLGYRDNEFSLKKGKNIYRILVLGDSFTFGYGVPLEKTYPKLLEELLGKNYKNEKNYQVINAGFAGGFSPDSYYLYFKKEGLELEPDLIIFSFFVFNDFTDLKDNTLWEKVDENGLPEKIADKNRIVDNQGYLVSKDIPWYYQNSFLSNSHLFVLGGKTIEKIFAKIKKEERDSSHQKTALDYYLCLFADQCFPEMEEIFEKTFKVIKASQQLAKENKTRFLFLIIPADVQLYDDAWLKYDAGRFGKNAPPFPQTRMKRFLEENKIEYLDLLPFFEENEEKQRLFYLKDGHFNKDGHQLTSQFLYQHIFSSGQDIVEGWGRT